MRSAEHRGDTADGSKIVSLSAWRPPPLKEGYGRWVAAGVLLLAILLAGLWFFHVENDPAEELARKATRVDLVEHMQVLLVTSSEAEKSAVMAVSDADSRAYAERARAAAAEVERVRQELSTSLAAGGAPRERALLSEFSQAFLKLGQIDDKVLDLGVQHTNLKAYALLFGPAADALRDMDMALSRIEAKSAGTSEAVKVQPLAYGAQLGVLRVQALLSPHIAEETDAKMDELESLMASEEAQVHHDLEVLAGIRRFARDADLADAEASYARFEQLKVQILKLSRENTNVLSLTISLNQKRKAMLLCVDLLNALRKAILEEPIAGVTYYGRAPKPR